MAKHPNINIPIRVALVLITVRLAFFFADYNWPPFEMVYAFFTFGGLIPLCLYGIWPRSELNSFFKDLKDSLRMMLVYGIIMFIFTIIFYAFVDTSFFPEKQTEIVKRAIEGSPDADVSKLQANAENFFSLQNFSGLLLLVLMAASLFYAVFFTAIKRVLFGYLAKKQNSGIQ